MRVFSSINSQKDIPIRLKREKSNEKARMLLSPNASSGSKALFSFSDLREKQDFIKFVVYSFFTKILMMMMTALDFLCYNGFKYLSFPITDVDNGGVIEHTI